MLSRDIITLEDFWRGRLLSGAPITPAEAEDFLHRLQDCRVQAIELEEVIGRDYPPSLLRRAASAARRIVIPFLQALSVFIAAGLVAFAAYAYSS